MESSSKMHVSEDIVNLCYAFKQRTGYPLYLVGGCVRDALLGRYLVDIDATTAAKPAQIKDVLRTLAVDELYTVGEKYGTIGCEYKGNTIEITTYRAEAYTDGTRKPEVVFGNSLTADLARRDFTINAMAYDPLWDTIIDPFDGRHDLRIGLIHAVWDAQDRFREDPLRMLRAVRLAVQLDFSITNTTKHAIIENSSHILRISNERIRDELIKILMSDRPEQGILRMKHTGLLYTVLPEIQSMCGVQQRNPHHRNDVFMHTMEVLANSSHDLTQRLSALFHDAGKPLTQETIPDGLGGLRDTFHGHEVYSERIARNVLRRLRFPTEVVDKVGTLCGLHMITLPIFVNWPPTRKAVRRFIRKCADNGISYTDVLELNHADICGHLNPDDSWTRQHIELWVMCDSIEKDEGVSKVQSPLNGDELMEEYELEAGPWIGELKMYLEGLVVDGDLQQHDKEIAWELADHWMGYRFKNMKTV